MASVGGAVPGMVVSVVAGTVVVVVVVVATAGSERTGPVVGLGDDDGLLGDGGRRHGRDQGLGRRRDAELAQAVAGQLGEDRRRHGGWRRCCSTARRSRR